MRFAIWYHFYSLKKNEKRPLKSATLLKVTLLRSVFPRLLNFTNGTNSRKPSNTVFLYDQYISVYVLNTGRSKSYNEVFCENSLRLLLLTIFAKKSSILRIVNSFYLLTIFAKKVLS